MKNIDTSKIWNAFGYTRISKDDRDRDESNSIKTQRDLIYDFARKNPDINIINVVADDGATGANFDRNAFKDMIKHIESGTVNCVIVKDFSRLGRDHIETGKYIERYFVSKKVRFISINDCYDSFHADMKDGNNSLIVPFKNIINEATLEDISIKTKSQLAIKRNNGEFIGNYTVYGYKKSSDKKIIVDEYASEIVKTIYEHKLTGYNEQQIAEMLNAKGILSPAEYKKASGQAYNTPFARNGKSLWSVKAIKRILTNRVYIGHLEQGKRTKVSYRVKKCSYQPREAWSVHENNHEAIINKFDFKLVQELMSKDTRISVKKGQLHLFSGLVICNDCNQAMTLKTATVKGKTYVNYVCSTHKRFGTCRTNSVSVKSIEENVLLSIRKQIEGILSADELSDGVGLDELKNQKKIAIEDMVDKAQCCIQEYNAYLSKSYAHLLDGVISQSEYELFRDDYNRKVKDTKNHIAQLQGEIIRITDDTSNREHIEQFKAHGNITTLDRRLVIELIHSIIIHGSKEIEIRLRYDNDFDMTSLSANRTSSPEKAVV